jgi:uncharacterized membrane protein
MARNVLAMFDGLFQPLHLLLVASLALVFLIPGVFYLRTLQKALARCSEQARTTSPESVWLMLIPLFNLAYQFILVINVAKSLGNEFARRGIASADREPGKSLGIAMCVLNVCSLVPLLGIPVGYAALFCWILYWVKVSGFSGIVATPFPPTQPSQSVV